MISQQVDQLSKEQANVFKELGNKFLKENSFDEAIENYTKAIETDPYNCIFYANRAQANLKLENYGLTISDCTTSIELKPDYLKAYYRRALANALILKNKELVKDLKHILLKQPNDKPSLKLLSDVRKILKRELFELAISSDDKDASLINSLEFDNVLIESSYKGMDLDIQVSKSGDEQVVSINLTREYIESMIELFKKGEKIPKKHAYLIIAVANQLFKLENSLVELSLKDNGNADEILLDDCDLITVCGDTHGQFYDVLNLFEKFGKVDEKHAYLFNGDFVDRGSWSCEVALLYYCLKIMYPRRMFINRGNHETNDMNKVYGFEDECKYKYSEKLFKLFAESFNSLPFATLIGSSYLVMHGGLFSDDNITVQDIKKINRLPNKQPSKEGIEMELLWTDPQIAEGRSLSKRGIGMQFGPDITAKFCEDNNLKCVIRSHEVRMSGVELEHNGKLVTVFSAPNYCDSTGNLGGIINITLDDEKLDYKMDFKTFEAVPHPDIKPMAYSSNSFGM